MPQRYPGVDAPAPVIGKRRHIPRADSAMAVDSFSVVSPSVGTPAFVPRGRASVSDRLRWVGASGLTPPSLSVMYLDTPCSRVELCKTAHFQRPAAIDTAPARALNLACKKLLLAPAPLSAAPWSVEGLWTWNFLARIIRVD